MFPYHEDELVLIVPRRHALAKQRRVAFAQTLDFDFVGLHTGSSINRSSPARRLPPSAACACASR